MKVLIFSMHVNTMMHTSPGKVWKNGSELERPEIKGFIQLTGAILNTN